MSKTLLTPGSIESIAQIVLEKAKTLTGSRLGYVSYMDPLTGHHICAAATQEMASYLEIEETETCRERSAGSGNGPWRRSGR